MKDFFINLLLIPSLEKTFHLLFLLILSIDVSFFRNTILARFLGDPSYKFTQAFNEHKTKRERKKKSIQIRRLFLP